MTDRRDDRPAERVREAARVLREQPVDTTVFAEELARWLDVCAAYLDRWVDPPSASPFQTQGVAVADRIVQGYPSVPTLGGDLHAPAGNAGGMRGRLRKALARHIDPDDGTMPARDGRGGLVWVPVDGVIDQLLAAIEPTYPVTSHPYQGPGFDHPCTAHGYGSTCGVNEYNHQESS